MQEETTHATIHQQEVITAPGADKGYEKSARERAVEGWRERLASEMEARKIGRVELTRAAGVNHTALRDILDRGVTPRIDTLAKLASALGISLAYLLEGDVSSDVAITVNGYSVGHRMWGEYAPNEAPVIPVSLFHENTVSVHIQSSDLEPRFHRDDIVVGVKHFGPNLDNLIGTECIIQTTDNQRYIGILGRGQTVGRFNIKSFDPREDDIPNVKLAWAAPITLIFRQPL